MATPRAQALLAIVLGALQSLAFGITALWLLPLLTLAWLRVQLDGCATPARAAGLGWCYGLGWLTAAVWWLFISLHRYGSLPAPLAALAVAALSATLALYLDVSALEGLRPGELSARELAQALVDGIGLRSER